MKTVRLLSSFGQTLIMTMRLTLIVSFGDTFLLYPRIYICVWERVVCWPSDVLVPRQNARIFIGWLFIYWNSWKFGICFGMYSTYQFLRKFAVALRLSWYVYFIHSLKQVHIWSLLCDHTGISKYWSCSGQCLILKNNMFSAPVFDMFGILEIYVLVKWYMK